MKGLNVGLGLMQGHAEHHTKTRGDKTKSDYKVSQQRLLNKGRKGEGDFTMCVYT